MYRVDLDLSCQSQSQEAREDVPHASWKRASRGLAGWWRGL